MRFASACIETVLLLAVLSLSGSCGKEKSEAKNAQEYARLTASAIKLYTEMQPLRSSRLGMAGSDSLLFTFSEDEIAGSIQRLKKLKSQWSGLSATNLTARDIDEATVVIHWLRGELFALETLQNHRCNPLLYCWMAEEALWGMPARITPPYDGELDAYRKRTLRIPALLRSGMRHIANPAEAHVRYAIERLDTLTSSLETLEIVIEQRYGTTLEAELDQVRTSLVDFHRFASGLLPVAHGKLILGAENLSKLFLYGELLNADPNVLVAQAENQIKRLAGEKSSLERRDVHDSARTTGEPIASRVERLGAELRAPNEGRPMSGQTGGAQPILEYPARVEYLSPIDKDPYLSIPPPSERSRAAAVTFPFSAPACQPYLFLSAENAVTGDTELKFQLLCAAPEIRAPDDIRCEKHDSLGALFASETFTEGWRYLALLERARDMRKSDPALYARVLNDRMKKLARMIVVFRLHAGVLTSDEAVRYLVETLGMDRDAATREVLQASVAPSVAWPGISIVLIEEMLKRAAYADGHSEPNRDLAKLLLASRDLPLALILPRIKSD